MVLKALVDAISQSLRDPHNLLHLQLVQSLKRDISQDVTEAFTESQPLVDQYPDLYRQSSSFLDFLFKLCIAPLPPTPLKSHSDGLELETCKRKLSEKEHEIHNLKEDLNAKNTTIHKLQDEITSIKTDAYSNDQDLKRKLEECQNMLKLNYNTEFVKNNAPFAIQNGETTQGVLTFPEEPDAIEAPIPLPALESSDTLQPHLEEWQEKLFDFLNNFKKDTMKNLEVSDANYDKFNELLKKYFPDKDPTDDAGTPSKSADEFSDILFAKLEVFLARLLDENQLKESLKLFDLEKHFNELQNKLESFLKPFKGKQREKMLKEVDVTKRKVENVVKGLIQKVSTLFGSKLPSVAILERLDGLEKSLLDKNIQLERLMESKNVDTETENKLKSKIEELEGKIHSKESNLSQKAKDLETQIQGLQSQVSSHDQQMLGVGAQVQQFLKEDKNLATNSSSNLQKYARANFPELGFKVNWEDQIMDYLNDFQMTKLYLYEFLRKHNASYKPEDKLINITFYTVTNLINAVFNTQHKLEAIYHEMLKVTDGNTQMLMIQSSDKADNAFFEWLRSKLDEMKQQLQQVQFGLTQGDVRELQIKQKPANYDLEMYQPEVCIQEMNGDEVLQTSETARYEALKTDNERWQKKYYDENRMAQEYQKELENLKIQCKNLVGNSDISTFYVDMKKKLSECDTYANYCHFLANSLNIPITDNKWDEAVFVKFSGITSEMERLKLEMTGLNSQNLNLQQDNNHCKAELQSIKQELEVKKKQIGGLEGKINDDEAELKKIQDNYTRQISDLKKQLNHKELPEKTSLSRDKRKRRNESSETVKDYEINEDMMKKLFLVVYNKYFEILYKNKWIKSSILSEEVNTEILTKLKILKDIQNTDVRKSLLMDILLQYVIYEFHSILNETSELQKFKDVLSGVQEIEYLEDLVQFGINQTTTNINRVMSEYDISERMTP